MIGIEGDEQMDTNKGRDQEYSLAADVAIGGLVALFCALSLITVIFQ